MNEILTIELTPIKYLERDNQTKRNHLQYYSRESPVQLEISHDESNQYDNNALQVFYDGIHIGYIRKRYIDEDLTDMIDNFCFEQNNIENVILQCSNGVYTISSNENNSIVQSENKKVNTPQTSMLAKELDTLIERTGWTRR